MKDGQGPSTTWGTHSDLPHRSRQGCNFSSLSARSRRETYFRKNSPIWMGRTFLGSTSCCSYVTLSSGTSVVTSCASVNERIHSSSSNCFEVGSCEAALCENVELPKQASPLAGSCEGDDGVHVFLPFASGTRSTHVRQFDMRQRSDTCCGSALLPHRAPCQFVPSTAPGNSRRLGALRTGGMSSNARAPSPVPSWLC